MDAIGVERSNGVADKCIEVDSDEFCLKASAAEVCSVNVEAEKVETLSFFDQEESNEMNIEKCCDEVVVEECLLSGEGVKLGSLVDFVQESSEIAAVEKLIVKGGQGVVENIDCKDGESKEVGSSIEEELRRVSLHRELQNSDMAGVSESKVSNGVVGDEASVAKIDILGNGVKESAEILNIVDDGGGKKEAVNNKIKSESESETESESESESSDSSSSSSSSDTSSDESDDDKEGEEEEEEPKRKADVVGGEERELEEGEMMGSEADEMVAWSDDEDDAGGNATKGPIRSKNEIADLPPVPPVNVSLLPHHHTLPVGNILSILGAQIVVEGVEKHNPLNEGSILWITESRSPLGVVDEIFGPVKNPFYIVRYNSETEVPAGVQPGTQISFVQEFADHVLNNANLYRKGYDASGEHDEELSEEAEFSDDEQEAEYRRMQKMKKRGTNDNKDEDRKKDKRKSKNQFGIGKHDHPAGKQMQNRHEQPAAKQTQNRNDQPTAKQAHDFANNLSTQNFVQPPGVGFPVNQQMQGMSRPQGNHPQQFVQPGHHPQQFVQPGNHPQQVLQPPFLNMAPFQQNIHMNPSLAFAPFPGGVSPNFLNQSLFGMGMQENALMTNFGMQHGGSAQSFLNQAILGMGMQGQNASTPTNVGANAVSSNGFQQMATSNPQQDTFQNFNPGTHRGGGRRPHRGGGRFGGGRGRRPS